MFAVIVILQRQGTAPALIGTVETIVAVGLLGGALLAPTLVRKMPLRTLAITVCWMCVVLIAGGTFLTGSVLIGVPMALAISLGPACNAALFGYQAAITPDRLQGRVVSVIIMAAMSLSSIAALLSGLFVQWWGASATVLAFAGIMAISAVTATVSKGIRQANPLPRRRTPPPPEPLPPGASRSIVDSRPSAQATSRRTLVVSATVANRMA